MRHRSRVAHAENCNPVPVPLRRISGCRWRSEKPWSGVGPCYAFRPLLADFTFETGIVLTSGFARELLPRGPAAFLFPEGARLMPKKENPFQLVPVMALATAERDL